MDKHTMKDLTQGSVVKHLINFAWPLLVINLLQALYNAVDSYWVGRFVGENGVGATTVSSPIFFIMVSAINGFTIATTSMVSQYAGAQDFDKVRKTINNSLTLFGIISIAASTVGIALSRRILIAYSVSPAILHAAAAYLNIILAGIIFTSGYNLLAAVLRGLGNSFIPMKYLAYTTLINFILDPVLISGWGPFPKLGVQGAAAATVLAQAISMLLLIRFFNKHSQIYKFRWKDLRLDKELTWTMTRIGLPSALQQTLVSVGISILGKLVNSYGVVATAAYGAASRIDSFAFMPAMSMQLATAAQVGQNLGAGKDERVKQIVQWGSILVLGVTLIFSSISFFFPESILRLFLKSPEYIQIGVQYLKIISFSYLAFALMFVTNGVMNGAGDTFATMSFSLISLWILRVPLAYLFARGFHWGTRGIWIAIAISYIIGMVISRGYYMTGRWKKKALVKRKAFTPQNMNTPVTDELEMASGEPVVGENEDELQ